MVLSMERRRGKVAVVTGASVGIGAKIVEMMVKNGMIVIGIARRSELVEKQAEKLANQPGKLHAMKVDMTDDGAIVKAFEEIERKFDPIHVLVNNAGIFPTGSLLNGTTEFWRKVIDTNVLALCTATREAIRIMKKNGVDGDIININSIAGHKVPLLPFLNIYPASKFAVTAICESLRQELVEAGSKIRVTVVGISRRVGLMKKHSEQLRNEPGKLYPMKVDLTNDEELVAAFCEIETKYGTIYVLINNAGIFPKDTLMDGDIAVWRKIIDTNLLALCIATREAIRIMKKNNINGQIIHINSIAGHYCPPFPNLNLYPASKHGVTAVTETLRQELVAAGSRIKVTSISPGFVWTEGVENLLSEGAGDASFLQPEDIADAIFYVLSTPARVNVKELTIKPVGERL